MSFNLSERTPNEQIKLYKSKSPTVDLKTLKTTLTEGSKTDLGRLLKQGYNDEVSKRIQPDHPLNGIIDKLLEDRAESLSDKFNSSSESLEEDVLWLNL
jgi:hypothetical protein